MPSVPAPPDPGWDDLAWLDRDPEREHWLDRAREYDEPGPEEEEYWKHDELTAEELAEIRAAAADEVLAVEAASTGRRGPGFPGSARVFFAGRATLTVPLATLLDLADRPGEIPGIGPIDPWLTRDLAAAAARNPKSTWCVTVTDQHGHAIGHGCARPGPAGRGTRDAGRAGSTGVHLHPYRPGWAAHWVRHLAAAHPGARPGPDRHPRLHQHRPVRASLRSQGA
jgi:hypothetical protein